MSIIVFLGLVTFPFFPRFYERLPYTGTRWLYPLSAGLGRLGEILPNFLGKWLRSYQSHPGFFILTIAVFVVILLVGTRLQKQIFGSMRSIFDNPLKGKTPAPEPKDFVHWLRTNSKVKEAFRLWRENVAPFIVLIIAVLFIIRGIFKVIDTAGFTSTPTPAEQLVRRIEGKEFPSNSICWASGVQIDKGKRYRITLTINGEGQDPWKDNTIDQFGLAGFGRQKMSPPMYVGLLSAVTLWEIGLSLLPE